MNNCSKQKWVIGRQHVTLSPLYPLSRFCRIKRAKVDCEIAFEKLERLFSSCEKEIDYDCNESKGFIGASSFAQELHHSHDSPYLDNFLVTEHKLRNKKVLATVLQNFIILDVQFHFSFRVHSEIVLSFCFVKNDLQVVCCVLKLMLLDKKTLVDGVFWFQNAIKLSAHHRFYRVVNVSVIDVRVDVHCQCKLGLTFRKILIELFFIHAFLTYW